MGTSESEAVRRLTANEVHESFMLDDGGEQQSIVAGSLLQGFHRRPGALL